MSAPPEPASSSPSRRGDQQDQGDQDQQDPGEPEDAESDVVGGVERSVQIRTIEAGDRLLGDLQGLVLVDADADRQVCHQVLCCGCGFGDVTDDDVEQRRPRQQQRQQGDGDTQHEAHPTG